MASSAPRCGQGGQPRYESFSPGSRSAWQGGMGILPGLGLGPGSDRTQGQPEVDLLSKTVLPMWRCGVRMKREGTVTPGSVGL